MNHLGLISMERLLQACEPRAWRFLRDLVPQYGQFCQGIIGVAMPQVPLGALSGGSKGLAQGRFPLLKLLCTMEPIQDPLAGCARRVDGDADDALTKLAVLR